jgi:hypothetical protein
LLAAAETIVRRIDAAPRDRLQRTKAKAIARAGVALGPTLDL